MGRQDTLDLSRAEFVDFIDLADGRTWMLFSEGAESSENVPRLFLDQFPNERACEDLREDGRIWFDLEDLPQIIERLTFWLLAYRECARDDASGPPPHPNWGALEAGPRIGGERP